MAVVAPCAAVTAEEFAGQVVESGLTEFKGFAYREAAFVLARIAALPPGTLVGTHFMEMIQDVGKREVLRIHKVIIRPRE